MMADTNAVDLTNCDREPIHIPGNIQPHGFLLACDFRAFVVQRHSTNAAQFLELKERNLHGSSLGHLIGRQATHEVRNALSASADPSRPGLLLGVPVNGRKLVCDISAHQHNGVAIVEFEPKFGDQSDAPMETARGLIGRLRNLAVPDELMRTATRVVRAMLGYDRVMVYRFAHDGAGQVVAESKRDDLEPYFGLHYPASDIPQQARELYLKNTIRTISDVNVDRVPIEPELDASGAPLDLSYAHLRSVSPIHCEYLRNMGVAASMSVSIVVGGKLWGLIACHHYSPRRLSMSERIAAEMFGEFFSLHLEALVHKRRFDSARAARRSLDSLLKRVTHHSDVTEVLHENVPSFMDILPCDGVGLLLSGSWTGHGSTPPASAIPTLARYISNVTDQPVWDTNTLSSAMPSAIAYRAEASGVLAVALSQIPRDYLLFFRKEVIQTVNWAGDPEKQAETRTDVGRLSPRKSFALWKETVERRSYQWTESDRDIAEAARIALIEHVLRYNELLVRERREVEARQKILNKELNHRIKNILALIKSVVSQPVDESKTLENYAAALKGRIHAMAHAHDQVIRGGGPLKQLLEAELSPYWENAERIELEGPSLSLDGQAFSVMALVIHELVTNAAKYGALSARTGQLSVCWTMSTEGFCEIVWRETGGPTVTQPRHQGFGTILVNRSVPFDLGGESEVTYAAEGVRARFTIPTRFVSHIDEVVTPAERGEKSIPRTAPLHGLKILLVEDQLIIALDMEAMLIAEGAATVEIAGSTDEALRKISASLPDAAVLDVNLGDRTSLPVAEELANCSIPFIFATGYGESSTMPEFIGPVHSVSKPCDAKQLAAALTQAMAHVIRPQP